ncbi:MAG: DUF3168 domain-containing protein [Rhizobiales bacterium]|nr:DUF3168 domain-containing protein [Hyphomicrobiales bacterium]
MSASLAFQKFVRGALAADVGLRALVPADNIVDSNARPEVYPRINLGEDQELPADEIVSRYTTVIATLHVWVREPGLATAKAIAGEVRRILNRPSRLVFEANGYRCIDCKFASARFVRDPDGVTAHGIITFESVIEEI